MNIGDDLYLADTETAIYVRRQFSNFERKIDAAAYL